MDGIKKYFVLIVYLNNCPFSESALELLDSHNIQYQIIKVDREEKDKYKTNEISTFPQIYLKRQSDNQSLLLGGYDNLKDFIDTFILKDFNDESFQQFNSKYKNWSKHAVLRMVELFVSNKKIKSNNKINHTNKNKKNTKKSKK